MPPADPAALTAGYRYLRGRGAAFYDGVLRDGERSVWECGHGHLNTVKAVHCAAAELERRREGARAVLELEHCGSCDVYYGPDGEVLRAREDAGGECPACERPLDPVRVIVL